MTITPDVIGIDVSKHNLDIFDGATTKAARLQNSPQAIEAWLSTLGEGRLVIFEATGAYDAALRQALSGAGVRFARVNPTAARCRAGRTADQPRAPSGVPRRRDRGARSADRRPRRRRAGAEARRAAA